MNWKRNFLFGSNWDKFSSYIFQFKGIEKKTGKPLASQEEKIERGEKFANLLHWLIKNQDSFNIDDYSMVIPAPTTKEINHVQYYGEPLAKLLDLNYINDLLEKKGTSHFNYKGKQMVNHPNIILLDDIYTGKNGTLEKNSKLLRDNGAGNIICIVLGKTTHIEELDYDLPSIKKIRSKGRALEI